MTGRTPTTSSRRRSRRTARCAARRAARRRWGRALDQGHVGHRRRSVTMDGGIAVLDYGIGNLGSAQKAFVHLGADARLVTDPDDAAGASGVVLPGVGAFGRCAQALRATGLRPRRRRRPRPQGAVPRHLRRFPVALRRFRGVAGRPRARSPRPARCGRLPAGVKRPQMQWNQLLTRPGTDSALLAGIRP